MVECLSLAVYNSERSWRWWCGYIIVSGGAGSGSCVVDGFGAAGGASGIGIVDGIGGGSADGVIVGAGGDGERSGEGG